VSFHTPETKRQYKQWVKKGQPGPLNAKVHAARVKQMVLVFFDAKGIIYTYYMPKGETVNASYIQTALTSFQAKATHNGCAGLVAALEQRPGPHHCHCGGLLSGEGGEDGPPPAEFAGPRPSRLFPLPGSESRAG
jgi:hypothetical protein